jgi:hypothetical protein
MSELTPEKYYSEQEFWNSRPLLKHVKLVASKTRKSPHAILGWLMVWMLTRISFETTYVTEVGRASLNMLFLMSAATGGGKSAARGAAADNFEFEDFGWSTPPPIQAGSGEAIPDSFYTRVKEENDEGKEVWVDDWLNPNHCRIFYNDEISFHKGKAHQNSSTLEATYLSMYSGDNLGRTLAGGKGKEVPAGQYRAIAVFNAQPENDPFRSDASMASGMPSRLLNLNASNPNARADYEAAATIEKPSPFKIPHFGMRGDKMPSQFRALPEMEAAHAEEDFLANEGLREHGRSHTLLTRAKTACVLAALEGRDYLVIQDWHLAGHLIDHSNAVDAHIKATLHKAARSEAGKSGAILGIKLGASEESKEQYAIERVAKNLKRHSLTFGYDFSKSHSAPENLAPFKEMTAKITGRDRDLIGPALESITEEQTKKKEETNG